MLLVVNIFSRSLSLAHTQVHTVHICGRINARNIYNLFGKVDDNEWHITCATNQNPQQTKPNRTKKEFAPQKEFTYVKSIYTFSFHPRVIHYATSSSLLDIIRLDFSSVKTHLCTIQMNSLSLSFAHKHKHIHAYVCIGTHHKMIWPRQHCVFNRNHIRIHSHFHV